MIQQSLGCGEYRGVGLHVSKIRHREKEEDEDKAKKKKQKHEQLQDQPLLHTVHIMSGTTVLFVML